MAEKITGAIQKEGKIMYLVKWKDMEEEEPVDSEIVGKNVPQILINFFESIVTFKE